MIFSNEYLAKEYACNVISKLLSQDELDSRLEDFKSYLELDTDKEYWAEQIKLHEGYMDKDDFKNGRIPRGIDELFCELVEWRAAIFAFQNVETEEDPFTQNAFYGQWLVGGTYSVFCLLAKLVSKDKRDNSLRKLWENVDSYIASSALCGDGEFDFIQEKMNHSSGQFTNKNSQAIFFRNNTIAHNTQTPSIEWDDVDKDIKVISRVWALITMWCSFGLMEPFRTSEQAFSGLGDVFSRQEINLLKEQREIYIQKVTNWCQQNLSNGHKVSDRSPFLTFHLKVSASIHSQPDVE